MLTKPHHLNVLTRKQQAADFPDTGGRINPKGAFLYIDTKDKEEIIIGLNKSLFCTEAGVELPLPLTEITDNLVRLINDEFSEQLSVAASISKSDGTRITISLINMKKTTDNARLLVDMIDLIKTTILAVA